MSAQDLMLIRLNLGEDPDDTKTHLLSDTALEAWLAKFNGNTDRATYHALRAIAASETLLSKKITSQHLSTDGPAVASALLSLAETYRAAADESENAIHFAGYIAPGYHRRGEAEESRWPL